MRFFSFPYASGIVPVKLFAERSLHVHIVEMKKKELSMCGQNSRNCRYLFINEDILMIEFDYVHQMKITEIKQIISQSQQIAHFSKAWGKMSFKLIIFQVPVNMHYKYIYSASNVNQYDIIFFSNAYSSCRLVISLISEGIEPVSRFPRSDLKHGNC